MVLAKCLRTYPDEEDMIDFVNGNIEAHEVSINYKDAYYFVVEDGYKKEAYEVVQPKVFKEC